MTRKPYINPQYSHLRNDIINAIEGNYVASKVFFSSKGITAEGGILESNEQECGIKKKMLKNSKKTSDNVDKNMQSCYNKPCNKI